MVYCHSCGKENKKGKFCKYCGAKLKTRRFHNKALIFVVPILVLVILEVIALNTPIEKENIFGDIKRGNFLLLGIEFCGNSKCNSNELYICKKDCVWCGDSTCQKEEIGNCYDDCEWCGDGYCQSNEDCAMCSKDCGNCKASAYCGDNVCNVGECALGCYKDCLISQCENGVCESQKGENCVTSPNDCRCKLNEKCNREIKSCEAILCGNGKCDNEENSLNCPNDCKEKYSEVLLDSNKDFPVIFVHGHSPTEVEGYNPNAFDAFQNRLADEGYQDMGIMLPNDYPPKLTKNVWSGKKVSVTMTYYKNKYDKLGGVVGPDDNQHVTTYAQRLRDVVEVVKHNTGKNKVIIIAHSMGGLVSRTYIKYYGGLNSVDKLVTVGTPNHGTYGAADTGCDVYIPILHERSSNTPECEDMRAKGSFIPQLNEEDETPGNIKYLTIIGRNKKIDSCPDSGYTDNVICATSVYLEGADNFYYDDFSQDYSLTNSLHVALISPSKAPQVYDKIVQFIKN